MKGSLVRKHLMIFGCIIILIVGVTTGVQVAGMQIARNATYERMNAQTSYYLEKIDKEILHMRKTQVNFFNDRKLVSIIDPKLNITPYEKREALLSVKEKISSLDGLSELTGLITLYLPKAEYVINSSSISRLQDAHKEMLSKYAKLENGVFYEDEDNFFVLENGTSGLTNGKMTSSLLVITYPKRKIIDSISGLEEKGGGAFFYSKGGRVIPGQHTDKKTAEKIFTELYGKEECLGKESSKEEQYVVVNGEKYLIFEGNSEYLGRFYQYSSEQQVMKSILTLRNYMYLAWFVIGILALFFVYYTQKTIHQPMKKLLKAFESVKEGNLDEQIQTDQEDEFSYLYRGFNDMGKQINHLVNEVLLQKNLIQRTELKQLQAQINPHFLYNSFFVLSRRVKRRDYEGAEQFATLLGKYFRFLTRNGTDFVELSQEVEHARCYSDIQGTRFRQRIRMEFGDLPECYQSIKVPRLILQPLLENAFGHGLEDKIQDGILRVRFEEKEGIRIHVEDNGESLTDEMLKHMRNSLNGEEQEEITGIVNIHKRLQLYFEGKAGLSLERSPLGGLDVCIWIEGKSHGKNVDCR